MNILITGGTGLVGTRLTELLIEQGHSVWHLSRKAQQRGNVKTFVWDIDKGIIDEKALGGADYIIHLAGAELYKITMNTRMGLAEGENIPVNLAVLNQFMFWRADVEFEFVSVQTQYHSLRLQSMTAYGAAGVSYGSRNVSYTSIKIGRAHV